MVYNENIILEVYCYVKVQIKSRPDGVVPDAETVSKIDKRF